MVTPTLVTQMTNGAPRIVFVSHDQGSKNSKVIELEALCLMYRLPVRSRGVVQNTMRNSRTIAIMFRASHAKSHTVTIAKTHDHDQEMAGAAKI